MDHTAIMPNMNKLKYCFDNFWSRSATSGLTPVSPFPFEFFSAFRLLLPCPDCCEPFVPLDDPGEGESGILSRYCDRSRKLVTNITAKSPPHHRTSCPKTHEKSGKFIMQQHATSILSMCMMSQSLSPLSRFCLCMSLFSCDFPFPICLLLLPLLPLFWSRSEPRLREGPIVPGGSSHEAPLESLEGGYKAPISVYNANKQPEPAVAPQNSELAIISRLVPISLPSVSSVRGRT
mmetsp:Transcript_21569/g.43314  ORF Transcript_21569/g.43314 Transcript_21569/m.43314 type:complete len:234 (-) Transcript_21569:172-873(-)